MEKQGIYFQLVMNQVGKESTSCFIFIGDLIFTADTKVVGVEPIGEVSRKNRLRWFGHARRMMIG
jgi:hypothetical protein